MSTPVAPTEQSRAAAGRVVRLFSFPAGSTTIYPLPSGSFNHANAPTTTVSPDIATSPLRADGQGPCNGWMWMVTPKTAGTGPAAQPLAPATAYGITPWVRNPITKQWGKTTRTVADFFQWYRTFGCNGGELWFQFDTVDPDVSGAADIHIVEL